MMGYGFKTNTEKTLVDAKNLIGLVLYDDDYNNTLKVNFIKRENIKTAWKALETIIYENKISHELESDGLASMFDTTTDDGAYAALENVYSMLDAIDDPEFWTEYGDTDMNDVMLILRDALGLED